MRLNKQTSDAIKILVVCASTKGELMRVADIAERTDLSLQNALKISHSLIKTGFLVAQRGRNGGVKLAKAADSVRIGEVVRAMEFDAGEPAATNLDGLVDDALSAFLSVLDQHTLAEFAARNAMRGSPATPAARKRSPSKPMAASAPTAKRAGLV